MLNIRDVFLRHPVTDNYRYIGFSDTLVQVSTKYLHLIHTISPQYLHTIYALVQVGTHFNLADGILTVPVSGVYLVSVHVLPAANKGPCINDVICLDPCFVKWA